MKRLMITGAAVLLAAAAGFAEDKPYHLESGKLVLESPFELEIGSTEYATVLSNRLVSDSTAWYDPETKSATTNWSWYANARLAKPYFGMKNVSLQFKEESRLLDSYSLFSDHHRPKMTLEECRKARDEIAADLKTRLGVEMEVKSDRGKTDAEIDAWIAEQKTDQKDRHVYVTTFVNYSGFRDGADGLVVGYDLSGSVDAKRRCEISLHAYTSRWPKSRRKPVDVTRDLVSEAERTKAHAAAEQFRKMLKDTFDVDFDTAEGKEKIDFAHEWTKRTEAFAGLDEQKLSGRTSFFGIPICVFALRHAYDGAVSEEELAALAAQVQAKLQETYGGPIPEADAEEGLKSLDAVLGVGVPAFGDTRASFQLDHKRHFFGRIGDIVVEVASAVPQYVRKGEDYEIAVRGGLTVTVTQSPIVAYDGEKK